jgi:resuscitation-promoting factor RpfA
MTDPNDKLARHYRDLAREEPPAALDASILAASRRAVAAPSLSRRWAMPVSIAAVLVLAFGVTLQMQREEPGIEHSARDRSIAPPSAPASSGEYSLPPVAEPQQEPASPPVPAAKAEAEAGRRLYKAQPDSLKKDATPPLQDKPAEAPARMESFAPPRPPAALSVDSFSSPPPAAQSPLAPQSPAAPPSPPAGATSSTGPAEARPFAPRATRNAADTGAAQMREKALPDPLRELERIAALRAEGRHAEADKALEEFRHTHPDFRTPEAVWERVKPR